MTAPQRASLAVFSLAMTLASCSVGPSGDLELAFDAARPSAELGRGSIEGSAASPSDAVAAVADVARPEVAEEGPPAAQEASGADSETVTPPFPADARAEAPSAPSAERDGGNVGVDATIPIDAQAPNGGALCTYGSPTNGTGSFTWYYFGQGTSQEDGAYVTACGYQGRETGMIDTVDNIANASPASSSYFAAIPGASGFNTVSACGACVEIVNGATSIVATIVDECPTDNGQNPLCTKAGHLDLSYAAWKALDYPSGDPSGTTWRFVSCPIRGAVVTRLKSGNADQLYIENTPFPVASVLSNGQQASHLSYGAWQLVNGESAANAELTLQDGQGHSLTIEVSGGGDTGEQFPGTCNGH
jgi:expansin (peptidoglycan-binding protein)